MTDPEKHIDHRNFFSQVEIPYSETKEEIWDKLSEKINVKENETNIVLKPKKKSFVWYASAAVIIILLGLTGFMKFYTIHINAHKGQHVTAALPDGSEVHLNAQTTISYKPYWWKFSRDLTLDGEAFFKVTKGKNFSIFSNKGKTEVLGTTFNIFARKNVYMVHCFTGKVRVSSEKGQQKILVPNQSVLISNKGISDVKKEENSEQKVAWMDNTFFFTAAPLRDVFEEIERQFDISIDISYNISDRYTGNFKRGSSPEEILDLICKPFNLKYIKTTTDKYIILKQKQ